MTRRDRRMTRDERIANAPLKDARRARQATEQAAADELRLLYRSMLADKLFMQTCEAIGQLRKGKLIAIPDMPLNQTVTYQASRRVDSFQCDPALVKSGKDQTRVLYDELPHLDGLMLTKDEQQALGVRKATIRWAAMSPAELDALRLTWARTIWDRWLSVGRNPQAFFDMMVAAKKAEANAARQSGEKKQRQNGEKKQRQNGDKKQRKTRSDFDEVREPRVPKNRAPRQSDWTNVSLDRLIEKGAQF